VSQTEWNEQLISNLKRWQKIELSSLKGCREVMDNTENPFIRFVMEVIHRDSEMHFTALELLISSFERKSINLNPEEVALVWNRILKHVDMEKDVVRLAGEIHQAFDTAELPVQKFIVEYLLDDEKKHDKLLEAMEQLMASAVNRPVAG
jgi:bacterioferritin (cytochrome b1)